MKPNRSRTREKGHLDCVRSAGSESWQVKACPQCRRNFYQVVGHETDWLNTIDCFLSLLKEVLVEELNGDSLSWKKRRRNKKYTLPRVWPFQTKTTHLAAVFGIKAKRLTFFLFSLFFLLLSISVSLFLLHFLPFSSPSFRYLSLPTTLKPIRLDFSFSPPFSLYQHASWARV